MVDECDAGNQRALEPFLFHLCNCPPYGEIESWAAGYQRRKIIENETTNFLGLVVPYAHFKICLPWEDTMTSISRMFLLALSGAMLETKGNHFPSLLASAFFLTGATLRYGLHRWPIPVSRECS